MPWFPLTVGQIEQTELTLPTVKWRRRATWQQGCETACAEPKATPRTRKGMEDNSHCGVSLHWTSRNPTGRLQTPWPVHIGLCKPLSPVQSQEIEHTHRESYMMWIHDLKIDKRQQSLGFRMSLLQTQKRILKGWDLNRILSSCVFEPQRRESREAPFSSFMPRGNRTPWEKDLHPKSMSVCSNHVFAIPCQFK